MKVRLFDYELPAGRIAQEPRERGRSRLLTLDRKTGSISHANFADFPKLLRPGDLLIRNDVRVRMARLWGQDAENRLVEVFLLSPQGGDPRRWRALAKPGRRAKKRQTVIFEENLTAVVEEVLENGSRIVRFDRPVDEEMLERIGHVPLPPYIQRKAGAPDRPEDREAYQTVFAREPLAAAAPTAGLHFTKAILQEIGEGGVTIADLTLAVGSGSFKPVTVEDTELHRIEAEEIFLPGSTLSEIKKARRQRQRIVAVGTTVARALEAWVRLPQSSAGEGDLRFSTDLFVKPGFQFRAVDALLTNFHLPRSTLLMLVCAFAGREAVLQAYGEAVRGDYLFYSFGDAMFIS